MSSLPHISKVEPAMQVTAWARHEGVVKESAKQ